MRLRHWDSGGVPAAKSAASSSGGALAVEVVGPFAVGEGPFAAEVAGSVDCAGGVSWRSIIKTSSETS